MARQGRKKLSLALIHLVTGAKLAHKRLIDRLGTGTLANNKEDIRLCPANP